MSNGDRRRRPATVQRLEQGKILGQKRALKPKEVWAIRVRLHIAKTLRDLALFNLAIDSKLRGCDLAKLRMTDVM